MSISKQLCPLTEGLLQLPQLHLRTRVPVQLRVLLTFNTKLYLWLLLVLNGKNPALTLTNWPTVGAEIFDARSPNSDVKTGMASLSVDPSGKGYLGRLMCLTFRHLVDWLAGSTSGVVLLRSLLPDKPNQPMSDGLSNPSIHSTEDLSLTTRITNEVLTHEVTNFLLNCYFSNYHTSYPFIHEASFRAAYSEIVPRPPEPIWQILFYTVLTIGAWTAGSDHEGLDNFCYSKAASYVQQQSIFEMGSLALVQALVLLSNYVQKRNMPNTGSNLLGLAVRMALSLGLHRELPEWDISLLEREMRRRVWWGLFIFDSGAQMTFGRPILLPDDVDVKPVRNISDEVTKDTIRLSAAAKIS